MWSSAFDMMYKSSKTVARHFVRKYNVLQTTKRIGVRSVRWLGNSTERIVGHGN
jgi:hypothetical protein